jgi:hypothetical protein
MLDTDLEPPVINSSDDDGTPLADTANTQRFTVVAVVSVVLASLPYLWVLWDLWSGTINPLRAGPQNDPIYDVQARAIMHGHLWIPNGSISGEAFVSHGHQYTYFGIFPSLLRIPIFLFTHTLDGRLSALSILFAWLVTALFSALLLWRLRIVLRGDALLGWAEAVSYGVLLASILVGSVLVFLASTPNVYNEDEAWSVALACASLFALIGVVERPSWPRVAICGLFVLFTNLNRPTTGYAAVLGTLLIALWLGLGRLGPDKRLWAGPVALAGLVAMAVGCAIDLIKFRLLFGAPLLNQLVIKQYGLSKLNGGQIIGLRYLPSTLVAYVDPANFRFTSVFPYITLPPFPGTVAHTTLFTWAQTANVPLSMPLLFGLGTWGVVAAFSRHGVKEMAAIRILLVTSAATAAALMVYGWIYERFVSDFLPLLVLAAMIGLIDVWRRFDARSRATRRWVFAGVGALGLFGFWANMGFSITPVSNWTQTQLTSFVRVQRDLSDITGHPLSRYVVSGAPARCGIPANSPLRVLGYCNFPRQVPMGTLFIQGRCRALFISTQAVPAHPYVPSGFWMQVERAPNTPICRSLTNERRPSG